MPLYIASINSGSNGNCYYVGNENEAVLVDAGISCRETERRLLTMGLSMKLVRAVFISHEHTDHTKGAEVISRKYGLPVYASHDTHHYSSMKLRPELLKHFASHEVVRVGTLAVKAFPKNHDASDPHSFVISGEDVSVGVMTDIGSACEHVTRHFRQCQAVFLEANYDEQMLESGNYPLHLKKRIRGKNGHLSNHQSLQIFQSFRNPHLSHLILSHLSENNNDPAIVLDLFTRHAGKVRIAIASRFEPTGVFTIYPSIQG